MPAVVHVRRALMLGGALTLAPAGLLGNASSANASTVSYVALGDSYTAGPLIPDQSGGLCPRSDRNYASSTAAAISAAGPKVGAVLARIRALAPHAKVYVAGYPDILPEAAAHGDGYVDTYTPTIGHDVCRLPGTKWIEGLVPTSPAAPFHPNAPGEAAMARALEAAIG